MKAESIVVAGASGFVGLALIDQLLIEFPNASIVALSRSEKQSSHPRVQWRQCDLFFEDSIASALPAKVDLVYYLVHSMEPTNKWDQGNFADFDLIMADNFARACSQKKIQQLIYLGGLMPEASDLSLHLQSRLEVEFVFKEYKIPYTFFRAGLIIGESGSSFQILLKLIKRLPVMICPAWTQSLTSPVDLTSVVKALIFATRSQDHINRTYDLAGCRSLTYLEMMRLTALHLGLKRYFFKVSLFTPTLSRLWVSTITETSKYLVYPLIESLQHPMVAKKERSFFPENLNRNYLEILEGVSTRVVPKARRPRTKIIKPKARSVQRIPVNDQTAEMVAESYFSWLPVFTRGLIQVQKNDKAVRLLLLNRLSLIELQKTNANLDRVTFAITNGILVRRSATARLEFRSVLNGRYIVVAIHDYAPSLPWILYRFTQLQIHQLVMKAFVRFFVNANFKKLIGSDHKEQVQFLKEL